MIISTANELDAWYRAILERNGNEWFDLESIIQSVYEALLCEGDIAIDGGAHMGLHTVPMARKVGPTGAVFAFEPIHEVMAAFRQLIESNCPDLKQVIHFHELAISDHSGTAEFLVADDPGYSGLRERLYPREMPLDRRKVRVERLDTVCAGVSPVRFIKLDLEGGEFHAMKGARDILKRERPVIVFEYDRFNSPGFYGYKHADLLEFFAELDYHLMDVIGTPFDAPAMWNVASLWYYFAVPRVADLNHTIRKTVEESIRRTAPWYTLSKKV